MPCPHEAIAHKVNFVCHRRAEGDQPVAYHVELELACAQCGIPFKFNARTADVRPDGKLVLQLREPGSDPKQGVLFIPVRPANVLPHPLVPDIGRRVF